MKSKAWRWDDAGCGHLIRRGLCALLAAALAPAMGAEPKPAASATPYYTVPPQFPFPAPAEGKPSTVGRFGPVGMSIELTVPSFGMKVGNIEKGSPAEAAGQLKKGQVIESINGVTLEDIDPREILGGIITKAEATDGKVRFMVKDTPDAPAREVVVSIPVLGAYAETWPLGCPKSEKIVRNMVDYLVRSRKSGSGQDLLFLLSTGEEKDLQVAREWVKALVDGNPDAYAKWYPWTIGYNGPALCEYYLRTGDGSVLPVIQKVADRARDTMFNGGWITRGEANTNFSYGGGAHVNAAGVHVPTFLLLAKECGVNVDERTLLESLRHFFRFAGRGNVAYGDHLPEGGFVDNGKTGGLAFAMAAAATLAPDGEKSVYARARDISAVKGFYSTSWMLIGHTGGGVGEIWRSAAMGLMHDKTPLKYRTFMDGRKWHYELSRRFDGSMAILGGGRYDDPEWGIGLALSYTIPRKTLRMTGAPPAKHGTTWQLPARPWGTAADDAFYSLEPAPDANGKALDVAAEKLATDASLPILNRLGTADVADDLLVQYAGHPVMAVREIAADRIASFGRDHLIVRLLKDKDPRVRHAGTAAIYGTFKRRPLPADRVTDEMAGLLWGMVEDPNESWWGAMNAMRALSLVRPELIVPHTDRVLSWLGQDEWWLNAAALGLLAKIPVDERNAQKVLPALGALLARDTRYNSMWALSGVASQLKQSPPAVQQAAVQMLGKAYGDVPDTLKQNGATAFLLNRIVKVLVELPGGYDMLFEVARKRFPDQPLPHKDLFMKVKPDLLGPKVRDALAAEAAAAPSPR